MTALPHLLAPGRLGSLELRNRIAMAPMGVNLGEDDGTVGDRQAAWFEARARGGAGLIIVGSASVAYPLASTDVRQIAASDDVHLPGLCRLADDAHAHGAAIAAQLVHNSTVSLLDIAHGRPLLAPSKKALAPQDELSQMVTADESAKMMAPFSSPQAAFEIREATDDDLAWAVERFVDAALRCQRAGFDGIELHAGHGYLLHAFLSPASNLRTDRWGGSPEARAELFVEVVRRVRAAVGPTFPLWARVGAFETHRDPGQRIEDALVAMGLGLDAGLDAIHVTAYGEPMVATGIVDGHTPHRPGALLPAAARVKRELGATVIAMGRLTPEAAERALADGHADLIAMGRPLIADPDLPRKLTEGRRHEVRPCVYQYRCIGAIFLNEPVTCSVNPEAGREGETEAAPVATAQHVVVAGGGPAGLECARRLAQRGHHVELWERGARLGGMLALAEQSDPDLAGLLDWLVAAAEDAGVDVRLKMRADEVTIRSASPDAVVWAVGADWSTGDGALGVGDLDRWIAGTARVDPPLSVRGSSKAALSIAHLAARRDLDVTLVPDDLVLAPELGLPGRFRLVADAVHDGVEIGTDHDPAVTTIDVTARPLAEPPRVDGVATHVVGDASGTSGLAAALRAAAELANAL